MRPRHELPRTAGGSALANLALRRTITTAAIRLGFFIASFSALVPSRLESAALKPFFPFFLFCLRLMMSPVFGLLSFPQLAIFCFLSVCLPDQSPNRAERPYLLSPRGIAETTEEARKHVAETRGPAVQL